MEPNDIKAKAEQEALKSLKRTKAKAEQDEGHIPPEHIVNGTCTLETFSRYTTLHPLNTIRVREAYRMMVWMKPYLDKCASENPEWGLHDILGDKPPKPEEGTTDGSSDS